MPPLQVQNRAQALLPTVQIAGDSGRAQIQKPGNASDGHMVKIAHGQRLGLRKGENPKLSERIFVIADGEGKVFRRTGRAGPQKMALQAGVIVQIREPGKKKPGILQGIQIPEHLNIGLLQGVAGRYSSWR